MGKRVRTLLRVSSKQQLHDDDIPMQREQAKQYIAGRPDWVFDREYMEKAVSAYKNGVEEREVLQEILSDAREKKFDVLLTYMSDRIGRQEEYSFYVAALNRLGIEVWTIKDGQLKTEDHIDKLLNYIRFWQNEGESKKTSMRVRDAQKELVRSGKFAGGKAPYGYRLVPSGMVSSHGRLLKKLEIVEEKAQVVRKIYDLALYQGMGYHRIAEELNRQGILAVTVREWKAGTIRGILTNPVYMGYLATNRRVHYDTYVRLDRRDWTYSDEQIPELIVVSQQVWEKAQEIREERKAKIDASRRESSEKCKEQYNTPFSTKGRLALTGLAVCGYCGRKLKNGSYCSHWTTRSGEKKAAFTGRYLCPSRCPERTCYSQKYLEGILFDIVEKNLERLKPIDVQEELQKKQNLHRKRIQKELESVQKQQKSLKSDIQTLEEKIPEAIRGDYYFSPEKLSSLIKEKGQLYEALAEKEQQIKKELTNWVETCRYGSELTALLTDWKELFKSADIKTKKMLLFSMIGQIRVKDKDIHIKYKIGKEIFASLPKAGQPADDMPDKTGTEEVTEMMPHETTGFPVPE